MGVLNVTADSFSDGGRYLDPASAIARGRELSASGADIVDVGGESTRPGAHGCPPEVESDRVVPVIAELVRNGIACSVDTTRAAVAAEALRAGATSSTMCPVVWPIPRWQRWLPVGCGVDPDALARPQRRHGRPGNL